MLQYLIPVFLAGQAPAISPDQPKSYVVWKDTQGQLHHGAALPDARARELAVQKNKMYGPATHTVIHRDQFENTNQQTLHLKTINKEI